MKRILIFGGKGFVGNHMSNYILRENLIFSFSKKEVDVTHIKRVKEIVSYVKPDYVINFASITTIKESFLNPYLTYEIGFKGTLNILKSLKDISFKGKLLNISSSEVYGYPKSLDLPLTENSPLVAMTPYSVAKISTEFLCNQWVMSEGFNIITVRPFTHIGEGQSERFSVSNFCKQIAEIELEHKPPLIKVGDINTTRDLTNVKDIVSAYYKLLHKGKPGEIYNVCSNNEISIKEILDKVISHSDKKIEIKIDKSKLRNKEQKRIRGDYSKLKKITGWDPKIKIDATIEEMIYYWKETLSR